MSQVAAFPGQIRACCGVGSGLGLRVGGRIRGCVHRRDRAETRLDYADLSESDLSYAYLPDGCISHVTDMSSNPIYDSSGGLLGYVQNYYSAYCDSSWARQRRRP